MSRERPAKQFRGTSLIRKRPPPWDQHRALGVPGTARSWPRTRPSIHYTRPSSRAQVCRVQVCAWSSPILASYASIDSLCVHLFNTRPSSHTQVCRVQVCAWSSSILASYASIDSDKFAMIASFSRSFCWSPAQKESSFWQPTGPNPLHHRDD